MRFSELTTSFIVTVKLAGYFFLRRVLGDFIAALEQFTRPLVQ